MKNYVTFGQDHVHMTDGVVFDKDCVATFESEDWASGRAHAFELFGRAWCMHYTEWSPADMSHYYPRGLVAAPDQVASGSAEP